MFNSIRIRILFYFLIISIFGILLLYLSLTYYSRRENIEQASHIIFSLQKDLAENYRIRAGFFQNDLSNPEFYITGKTDNLNLKETSQSNAIKNFQELSSISVRYNLDINKDVNDCKEVFLKNCFLFNQIINLSLDRGFKDWGTEGKMRSFVHQLELFPECDPVIILSMRRHEKDFIIRGEYSYVNKFYSRYIVLSEGIKQHRHLTAENKVTILTAIDGYYNEFRNLVRLDSLIGKHNNSGLMSALQQSDITLDSLLSTLLQLTETKKQEISDALKTRFYIFIVMILAFNILFALYFSNIISKPIKNLSAHISYFVETRFQDDNEFIIKPRKDEMGLLIRNFSLLKNEIVSQIKHFNKKVDERTYEILRQKTLIEIQNKEIIHSKDEVVKKNLIIEQQKKDMVDSIKYARRIQDAMLPDEEDIKRIIPESFVIYKPRDIVSGDFYQVMEIKNNRHDITVLAVADCTGHGVPGSLLSIIGQTALIQAVKAFRIIHPDNILSYVNKAVSDLLHAQSRNPVKDGMEMGVVTINNKTGTIEFSGSYISLYSFNETNNDYVRYKGDKTLIGNNYTDNHTYAFTRHVFVPSVKDTIYMFTDGIYDQFGGDNNKKMQRKKFLEFISSIQIFSTKQQKPKLEFQLSKWMGTTQQTDDITIIGFNISVPAKIKVNTETDTCDLISV